jgi:hypothetical protein
MSLYRVFLKVKGAGADKVRMVENRLHPRFACSRVVEAQFFRALRLCGVRKAVVMDISKGGLLLRFEAPPPQCDHLVVTAAGFQLSYQVRHSYQREGSFFAGVQLVK